MNTVILMGRLTKDPEIRYTAGDDGNQIASYSIAVNRAYKRDGQPESDFFDCVCFGKQAEFAEKYLRKGIKMVIQGRIQNNNYKDKEGRTVYRNQIVIASQEFAESKNAQSGSSSPRQEAAKTKADADGFMNIPDGIDEELPFN